MSIPGQALWCDACQVAYDVPNLELGRSYRCARCRGAIVDPEDASSTTWLYSAQRSSKSSPTLDDARITWSDNTLDAADAPPVRNFDRYEISDELGRGGMGVVYRAWDTRHQREVALKVLLGGRWADRTATERFLREARAAAKLEHPGLVRVLDSGEWQGQPFYAMDLIDGPSLKDVLDDIGRTPLSETLRIGAALARALEHAHQRGVTHRDVKPENVLLKVTGEPILTDFGLVMEANDARLTHTGQVMGTPAYLAPELARGEKNPSWPLVDIYALGTLLYELATGRPAYEGDSGMQVLMEVLEAGPDTPRSIVPDIPRDLEVVIQRAMARYPSARFRRASAIAEELDRIAAGRPIETAPLSLRYRARMWLSRHGRSAAVALASIAVVAALMAIAVGARHRMQLAERERAWEAAEARWQELLPQLERLERKGDREASSAAFQGFVDSDQWREAPALADAWRTRARHLRDRGDPEGELEALARGWAAAPTESASNQALDGLLQALASRWAYDRVETLAGDHATPSTDHRRAVAAVARRDLAAAGQVWVRLPEGSPPSARLVEVLLHGTPTAHQAGQARVLEDGSLLLIGQSGVDQVEPRPDLPLRRHLDLGRPVAAVFPAGEGRLLTWGDDRAALVEEQAGSWMTLVEWPEDRVLDTAVLDDPDIVLVGVGPYARHLVRLEQDGTGSWNRRSAHPGTDQSASDVVALDVVTLDDDGRPDILVSVGPWNAFDLRWLTPDAEGELVLRARRKLGHSSAATSLEVGGRTLVAAAKADQYPSRRTFPADRPYGDDAGLYLLDPEQDLATTDRRLLPTPVGQLPPSLGRMVAADLDGDGRDDVAMGATTEDGEPWLLLYRQDADGELHHARIQGIELLAGAQLDDDEAIELVVSMGMAAPGTRERPVWVLGTGGNAVPAVPEVLRPHDPVPAGLPIGIHRAWSRAERLASAGLYPPAASLLTDLAGQVEDATHSDAAWLRSASLWLAADRPDRAAAQVRNVQLSDNRAAALDLRSRALIRAYRFDDAAQSDAELERMAPLTEALATALEGRRPLHAQHASSPELSIAFDTPLGSEWRIHRPLAVRRDPRQATLALNSVVGAGVLAEVPLVRNDEVVSLELTGRADRVEWAAGLAVTLGPADARPGMELGLGVAGWGGGSLLQRQVGCVLPGDALRGPRVPAEPAEPVAFRARVQVAPQLREIQCWVEDADGRRVVETRAPLVHDLPDGDWLLRLRFGGAEVQTPMLAKVQLERITLHGMELPPDRPNGASVARLQAEGHVSEALAQLSEEPSVLRAALLGELGRLDGALEALPSEPAPVELAMLLRSRPQLALSLRDAWADDWFPLWHRTWNVAIVSHPDDPALQERLRTDLQGLVDWAPTTREERAIRTQLLALRGRAWWLGGRTEAARRDLLASIEGAPTVLADAKESGDGNGLQTARQVWLDSHALLAAIVLAGGDETAALDYATRSLEHAPFRELAIDRLLLDPGIANKKGAPEWDALLDQ